MSEPGQPNASVLKLCFWEAVKRCAQDEDSDLKLVPCGPDDPGAEWVASVPRNPSDEVTEHVGGY